MTRPLVIRADAGPCMGAGHVMRCVALAQAWQDSGGSVTMVTATESSALLERLSEDQIEIVPMAEEPGTEADAAATAGLARQMAADWVVVDGYQFDARYQKRIREDDLRLLFLDDYGHAERYSADIVLNQNPVSLADLYTDRTPATQLLLGSRYLLLRREFQRLPDWKREIPSVARKILVTTGGGDNRQVTRMIIRALETVCIENLQITVIARGIDVHALGLETGTNIRVVEQVADITESMAWADLAITGGGGTSWEAAFMGLPSLAVVIASNQLVVVDALSAAGALRPLGTLDSLSEEVIAQAVFDLASDAEARRNMSLCGPRLLDGHGAARVVARMQSRPLKIREATADDCRMVFDWANEPAMRAASFCSDPILWETHVDWFARKLNASGCHLFIAIDDRQVPVGQVRFDVDGDEADISVGLHSAFRGLGYGVRCLELASAALFNSTQVTQIRAFIKPENRASIAAFERAGYDKDSETTVRGQRALRFVLRRGDGHSCESALDTVCGAGSRA